ncbi:MAG: hypothetical protein AAF493_17530 [Pseudomonadota bacterium]
MAISHRQLITLLAIALLGPLVAMSTARAMPIVSLHSTNVGIGDMSFSVSGTTITIDEVWTSTDPGFLQISGLENGVDYTIVKNITNNSGDAWESLSNEVLDPIATAIGDTSDDLDVLPYPAFVPDGFTTSNDNDGLSFAQGSGIPRTSLVFPVIDVDELTDVRDFLDFSGGSLADSAVDTIMFGLSDNTASNNNQPFLLSQRPSELTMNSVPSPGSLAIMLLGLGVLAWRGRAKAPSRA